MVEKSIWLVVLLAVLMVVPPEAEAKYRGFARELFFDRHAGAAGAATGRTGVTSSGDIINTFYNPAGLADAKGLGFCLSWSDPYYLMEDAEYRYVGGNAEIPGYGTVGLSRYKLDYGPTTVIYNGGQSQTSSSDASVLVFTLAGEPRKDLLLGVNISSFQYSFPMGVGRARDEARAFWADVGLIKYFTMARTEASGHWLKVGGSLSNVTYSSIDTRDGSEDLPVALRLGGAYEMGWWGPTWRHGVRTVETVVQAEYQDVLNYDHRTAVKLGGEIRLVETLALRLGYFRETVDDYGYASNKDAIESTTYGFGINLPLHKVTRGKLPLRVGFDYAKMKQPEYTESGDTDDFRTFTFCAGYYY